MIEIYVLIFLISLLLTSLLKIITIRRNIVDIPNKRSSHTTPTPRGGGLAIVIAWFAGIIILYFKGLIENDLFFALLGSLPLAIIGVIDDIIGVKPIVRIIIQSLSAFIAIYFLKGILRIDFGCCILTNLYLNSVLGFIMIIWFINLFNFTDGIDGYLSTGVIMFSIILFIITKDITVLILIVSILGFLVFNWPPAKIFMGDVGSTVLGFTFIVFAIYFQNSKGISLFVPLIISSLFWFDTTYTLIRRFFNNEKLSKAHKKHAYQRLIQAGFSHKKVVLLSVILNALIGAGAYLAYIYTGFTILILFFIVIILFLIVKIVDEKKAF